MLCDAHLIYAESGERAFNNFPYLVVENVKSYAGVHKRRYLMGRTGHVQDSLRHWTRNRLITMIAKFCVWAELLIPCAIPAPANAIIYGHCPFLITS